MELKDILKVLQAREEYILIEVYAGNELKARFYASETELVEKFYDASVEGVWAVAHGKMEIIVVYSNEEWANFFE